MPTYTAGSIFRRVPLACSIEKQIIHRARVLFRKDRYVSLVFQPEDIQG